MDPADLQILLAARIPRHLGARDHVYDQHWAIHIAFDADVALRIGDRSWALHGDWLWTGFPGPRIVFAASGPKPSLHWRYALTGGQLARWRREGLWPEGPLAIRDREALRRCADRILAQLDGDRPLDTRRRANAVEALLLEVQHQQEAIAPLPTFILDCQRRLQAAWRRTPDYAALAGRIGMPLSTLRKAWRRHCGEPIHTWFLRLRHREAQRLLLETDLDLGTIAERCGYADQAWFSRQFSRFAGMSPLRFRRAAFG